MRKISQCLFGKVFFDSLTLTGLYESFDIEGKNFACQMEIYVLKILGMSVVDLSLS